MTDKHFWRDDYFQTLRDVATEASASPEWADYAAFCTEYERGLRPQAFAILDRFIASMEYLSFAERRRFVSWLLNRADGHGGRHMLVPHPLQQRIVEPTLKEWIGVEPAASEPHRWLGGYEHLKRAIELDPHDELARRKFVAHILSRVGLSTHELPAGYLGTPQEDLVLLDQAEAALPGLSSGDDRKQFADSISDQRALIEEYLRKRSVSP